jgi:catechol 2,3-dioxygenase-like lactoylglutathione lyase family enzyme
MSRLFGPISQNGYVVRDLDTALEHWTRVLGVGPFFVARRVAFAEISYRGEPTPLEMAVAMAYSGDLQIELIQPTSEAPSIYRDHLAAHGEGLQHVGVLTESYARDLERMLAAGFRIVQGGRLVTGLAFAYLDSDRGYPGTMVELIECTRGMRRYLDTTKAAAQGWDGSDPVRAV